MPEKTTDELTDEMIDKVLRDLGDESERAYEEAAKILGKSVNEVKELHSHCKDSNESFSVLWDVVSSGREFVVDLLPRYVEYCKEKGIEGRVCKGRLEIDLMVLASYIAAAIAVELSKEIARRGSDMEAGHDSYLSMCQDAYAYAKAIDTVWERGKMMRDVGVEE